MCHRHGDNGELVLGCSNTIKVYKSNTTAPQQNGGRNATLIMNLGHDHTLQFKTCVDDDHKLANITMNQNLGHGEVIAFGTQLNAVATHKFLVGVRAIEFLLCMKWQYTTWYGRETRPLPFTITWG